jgi:type III secretion system FlhB-like substrate exporter
LLSRVEVGAEIPEAMYRVVAELFAALWSIDRSIGNARQQ